MVGTELWAQAEDDFSLDASSWDLGKWSIYVPVI